MTPHPGRRWRARLVIARTFLPLLAIGCLFIAPAAAEPKGFSLGQWGIFAFDLPEGWTAEWQDEKASGGPAVRVVPPTGQPFSLLMTPGPHRGDAKEIEQRAREVVENTAKDLQKVAVEKRLKLQEIQGKGMRGTYVSVTDKTVMNPTAEDFKYMDQGAAAVGALMMTFTALTNVADGKERAQALDIVRSARHLPPQPPWRTKEGTFALAMPGKPWRFTVALPGFDIGSATPLANGPGVTISGPNAATHMMVSVFLEVAKPGLNAVGYRDQYWARLQKADPIRREDVKQSEMGEAALLEFRVPEVGSMKNFNHKSMNAMWVRDGVWIDLHLSQTTFKQEDQALFEQIVKSVRFEEEPAPAP